MKLKGDQKHIIENIEENNEVGVLQLQQYAIQVGRRRNNKIYTCLYQLVLCIGEVGTLLTSIFS